MNLKRAATLVVGGGALAAWFAAAATSGNRDVQAPLVIPAPPIDARGAALASEIERLNDRLRPTATPRSSRNLFEFVATKPAAAPAAPALSAQPASSAVVAAAAPAVKLVGIAEDAGENGIVRTAIVSAAGQLLLVKEGDAATSRYRVVKIAADVVELADTIAGTPVRLALK